MSAQPLAARLNNPGDLRPLPHGVYWHGQTGIRHGFCMFDSERNGWRALAIDVQSQWHRHHLTNPRKFFDKYAPSSDHNNPTEYAESVAHAIGLPSINANFDMTNGGLVKLCWAIAAHESDATWDSAECATGISDGLAYVHHQAKNDAVV